MNEDIRKQFEKDGYYHAKGVYSEAEIDRLEADFDRIIALLNKTGGAVNARWKGAAVDALDTERPTVLQHTHNVQKFSAEWLRAWLHPRFLEVACAILGEDVILHHSKLFQKPSENGAPFPMHQDWPYFPTMMDTMIAGIVHVSDATDEMGCLRVYPGSHRLGRLENSDGREFSETLSNYPIENAMPVECARGDVVFFHYFTLHGSLPNCSDRIRKTVLAQLHAGNDVVEDPDGHVYERLVLSGFNHEMRRSSAFQTAG